MITFGLKPYKSEFGGLSQNPFQSKSSSNNWTWSSKTRRNMTLRWTAGPHRRLPKQMMTLTRTKKKTHIQGRGVGKFACFFLLMVICTGLTAVQPAEAAFPVVQAINTSSEPINTANHTVNLPSSISSGDLLIVFFSCDANETVTWPGGWTSIFHQTNRSAEAIGQAASGRR